MAKTFFPDGYRPALGLYDTQAAISRIKRRFEDGLRAKLNLKRVTAPLFVSPETGLNDNLSGNERPVGFDIPAIGANAEVVHSLAKWKRMALYQYGFSQGVGLYTDMNAIRRDEELDNLHSVYVDQWDWEKILPDGMRTADYLKETVQGIADVFCDTLDSLKRDYPTLTTELTREVYFITSQELEDRYPGLSAKERENRITKEYKTVFIMGIGGKLKSGKPHDGRAPDYDDWSMNGDILYWSDVLGRAMELSSMGIRVDAEALKSQLAASGLEKRAALPFHKMLLEGKLPLTIGGGIGQSRTCMLLLGKAHIGEVQVSLWDDETAAACAKAGVALL